MIFLGIIKRLELHFLKSQEYGNSFGFSCLTSAGVLRPDKKHISHL